MYGHFFFFLPLHFIEFSLTKSNLVISVCNASQDAH